MFRPLMVSALGAGLAAGVVAAILQFWLLVPMIGEAELYESGTLTHFGAEMAPAADHAAAGEHAHEAGVADDHSHGETSSGLSRHLATLLATVATYLGFALLLVAGFALAQRSGVALVTVQRGLLWGLAGFAATVLFPALGLPPELPGSAAGDLQARQFWWLMTAGMTAAGIALLALAPGQVRWSGLLLLVAPHLIGAPHPDSYAGVTPPEMAALFAGRAVAVGAVAWAVLGASAGWIWQRQQMSPR